VPDVYGLHLTAPHTQIVGQSLALECSMTTVRGITSRVDILWSSDGSILNKENNISRVSSAENFAVYTNTYAISPLSVSDDGRTYWCEAVINSKPPFATSHNITLDVIGIVKKIIKLCIKHEIFNSSNSYYHHNTIWSYTRSYGR